MAITTARAHLGARHVIAAAAVVGAATLFAGWLTALQPALPSLLPGYSSWGLRYSDPSWYAYWILGDITEATLAKSFLGGLLMIAGAALAHVARRRGRRWQGFAMACGTGELWPWVLAAAGMGLLASNLLWGWTLHDWQPTFAPVVSLPPALVIIYGPGWRVAVTGAILGVLLVTPLALILVNLVCRPLGVSPVAGSTLAMSLGGLAAFWLCRRLPWLPPPRVTRASHPDGPPARYGPFWVVRRMLADFTEAHFYGNEWAGAFLLLGCVLHFLLNPAAPAYGSGLLPQLLLAQLLTAACGVLLWSRRWASHGWYPTFVPIVSVAPATVLTFGGTVPSIVAGAVIGAAVAPPLAAALARRLPDDVQPMVAYTAAMAVCTAALIPLLDLIPGFPS
ncbi:hypothetical protein HCN51_46015 [Nonomuraea sp. FMUSA5-5]|uniref:Integral membrane protein n=1 Tax=Nonomuraea composti TaxID=2720023 RepID=A0ABX1BIE8_9ACTN|nr:hypothetical protein [Nonomuraea sp. FMUSA5-5]NJP96707.1 hypothetical protein [Nonomuraea sp. FMUSA5-5]